MRSLKLSDLQDLRSRFIDIKGRIRIHKKNWYILYIRQPAPTHYAPSSVTKICLPVWLLFLCLSYLKATVPGNLADGSQVVRRTAVGSVTDRFSEKRECMGGEGVAWSDF